MKSIALWAGALGSGLSLIVVLIAGVYGTVKVPLINGYDSCTLLIPLGTLVSTCILCGLLALFADAIHLLPVPRI